MKRKEKGIAIISLAITVVVLIILTGITLTSIIGNNGITEQTKQSKAQAERESIIEKIEADLYNEKIKTGAIPDRLKLVEIINKEYGTVSGDSFTTTTGNYTIELTEISGWE